jgi:hypothetical protein
VPLILSSAEDANSAAVERALRTHEAAVVYVSIVDGEVFDFCIAGEADIVPEYYQELGKMIPSQERGINWSCKFLYALADH